MQVWGAERIDKATAVVPGGGIYLIIAAGVAMVILSIVGCCGIAFAASKIGRGLLYLYSVVVVLIAIVLVVAAALLFVTLHSLQQFEENGDSRTERVVDDAYEACCVDEDTTCWVPEGSGVVTEENCESREKFQIDFLDWLADYIRPIAIVATVIAALQLLAAVGASQVARSGKYREEDDEAQQRESHREPRRADDVEQGHRPQPVARPAQ